MSRTNLRDWAEDAAHENGKYHNQCVFCGEQFIGHKRRVVCRACDQYLKRPDDAVAQPSVKEGQKEQSNG